VSTMDGCQASLKTLAHGNEKRITLLEQADANQAERMNELVVKPLEKVVDRLEGIAKTQQKHGELLAGHTSDLKSIGRSVDLLRDQVNQRELS